MVEPPEHYKPETISPSMWNTIEDDDLAFIQQYGIECDSMACKICNELTTINRCPACGVCANNAGVTICECGTISYRCSTLRDDGKMAVTRFIIPSFLDREIQEHEDLI